VVFRIFHFYLLTVLKIFLSLGNDRPEILVRAEDCVLKAIISISEGKPRESVMETLYSQLFPLQNDLLNDSKSLAWFDLATAPSATPSTPRPSESPPESCTGESFQLNLILFLTSLTQCPIFYKMHVMVSGAH
jgi:hypothetical protein